MQNQDLKHETETTTDVKATAEDTVVFEVDDTAVIEGAMATMQGD